MAKWQRLTPHADVALIGDFAERFGLDPDWVFENKSFGTVMAFAVESKERGEYRERFNWIYNELNKGTNDNVGGDTGGK